MNLCAGAKPKRQSGVLAFERSSGGKLKLMLVTPRYGGSGWLIPKGNVERGMSSGDSAQKEAFEEAGIEGFRSRRPIGFYTYRKKGRDFKVAVFLLKIEWTHEDWLERLDRKRRLFSAKAALKAVKDKRLAKMLARLLEQSENF